MESKVTLYWSVPWEQPVPQQLKIEGPMFSWSECILAGAGPHRFPCKNTIDSPLLINTVYQESILIFCIQVEKRKSPGVKPLLLS